MVSLAAQMENVSFGQMDNYSCWLQMENRSEFPTEMENDSGWLQTKNNSGWLQNRMTVVSFRRTMKVHGNDGGLLHMENNNGGHQMENYSG